ncbi:MAG: hypothetical protein AABY38_02380 [Planctomycetota bacterium]
MAKVKWTVFRSICLLYVIAACLLFSIKDNDSNGLAYSGEITGYELSPRASKPKYIEEGEEILTKFVFEEISPLGLLVQYQEIDYINNDKDRWIHGILYEPVTSGMFPLPVFQTYLGEGGFWTENILIGIEKVKGERKIGIWRYIANNTAVTQTCDDISAYKVKWRLEK